MVNDTNLLDFFEIGVEIVPKGVEKDGVGKEMFEKE